MGGVISTTALVAVENHLFARGLTTVLEETDDFVPIGTVHRLDDVFRQAQEKEPDLLLLDMSLGGTSQLVARIKYALPAMKVVVVGERPLAGISMRRGADGFVVKSADATVFVQGLRQILAADEFTAIGVKNSSRMAPRPLTAREAEILDAAGGGLSNKRIAAQFGVSETTVKFHLGNAFRKLGVSNRAQGALAAYQHDLASES